MFKKETKRPSKEMQVSIARQLGLQPTTVGNFFMNARRRLHDKWHNCEYDNNGGAKITENNNENNIGMAAGSSAGIMIVDGFSQQSADPLSHSGQPHDLSFALEAIESIEQPPPPVVQHGGGCSDTTGNGNDHTNSSCVYSLTSL